MLSYVKRSLMLRTLLPTGILMVILIIAAVFGLTLRSMQTAHSALDAKAKLTAEILARGAGESMWNMDAQGGNALLAAMAADPDYSSSIIIDDKGRKFVEHKRADTVDRPGSSMITKEFPVIKNDGIKDRVLGK